MSACGGGDHTFPKLAAPAAAAPPYNNDRSNATMYEDHSGIDVSQGSTSHNASARCGNADGGTCNACPWRSHCLPAVLPANDWQVHTLLFRRQIAVQRRHALYREGDPFIGIYVVRSGALKSQATTEDGREQVIAIHMAGDHLGGEGLASGQRTRTVSALEDSVLCSFPIADLKRLMSIRPQVQRWFHRALAAELTRSGQTLALLRGATAEERVAGFLVDLWRRAKASASDIAALFAAMNRGDIAFHLGLSRETVSRVFSRLHHDRVIARDGDRVRLLDIAALEAMAGGHDVVHAPQRTPVRASRRHVADVREVTLGAM